jgi:hypothetical protein
MQQQLTKIPPVLARLNLPGISSFIVSAVDLVFVYNARVLMRQCGVDVTLITGPAVNIDMSVQYTEKNFSLTVF